MIEDTHPFIQLLASQRPKDFSVQLDGIEIFKGRFTNDGVTTLLDTPVSLDKPRGQMTIFFDDNPVPVYSLKLGGETGQPH